VLQSCLNVILPDLVTIAWTVMEKWRFLILNFLNSDHQPSSLKFQIVKCRCDLDSAYASSCQILLRTLEALPLNCDWRNKIAKNSPSAYQRTNLSGYIFATKILIGNRKKLGKQQYLPHLSSQYGKLRTTNGWDRFVSLGHPSKFQRVSRLGFVNAATSLNGSQPNFVQCLVVSWAGTLYIHFWGLLPRNGILPGAKFTLCPSMHHRTSFSCYIFATKASIDNRKKNY